MKIYVSFGQIHVHSVNGKTFDKNVLAEISCSSMEEGRDKAFEYFGDKFGTTYDEKSALSNLHYFPNGILPVE